MPITIDFSQVKDFSAIPEKKYPANVTDIVQDKSKESGNPMLVWTFQVSGGEFKGRKIMTNTVLIPESLWVLRNYLTALGAEIPLKAVSFEPKEVIGKPCIIDVGIHKYQGQDRNHINNVLPPAEGQVQDAGTKLINKVSNEEKPAEATPPTTEEKPVETKEEKK